MKALLNALLLSIALATLGCSRGGISSLAGVKAAAAAKIETVGWPETSVLPTTEIAAPIVFKVTDGIGKAMANVNLCFETVDVTAITERSLTNVLIEADTKRPLPAGGGCKEAATVIEEKSIGRITLITSKTDASGLAEVKAISPRRRGHGALAPCKKKSFFARPMNTPHKTFPKTGSSGRHFRFHYLADVVSSKCD
jgi:hypothetical protein